MKATEKKKFFSEWIIIGYMVITMPEYGPILIPHQSEFISFPFEMKQSNVFFTFITIGHQHCRIRKGLKQKQRKNH